MNELVKRFADIGELSRAAAADVAELARTRASESGRFTIALAGGHTPKRLYELLSSDLRDRVPWDAVHVFWGDERCVDPKDSDSNYRMAWESMLSRVPIPEHNVHRIAAEKGLPGAAAESYEEALRDFFGASAAFDLVLLGMGGEGHTASLFPGSSALDEKRRWVVAVRAPEGISPPVRISLTLPPLNSAREVYLLVSGKEKRPVLQEVLAAPEAAASKFPVAMVKPARSKVWYIDEAAGG